MCMALSVKSGWHNPPPSATDHVAPLVKKYSDSTMPYAWSFRRSPTVGKVPFFVGTPP